MIQLTVSDMAQPIASSGITTNAIHRESPQEPAATNKSIEINIQTSWEITQEKQTLQLHGPFNAAEAQFIMRKINDIETNFSFLNKSFLQGLTSWNTILLPGLNLKDIAPKENPEKNKEEFIKLNDKDFKEIKFTAVAKANSIPNNIWQGIPDKIESPDYDGPDGEDSWFDTRSPKGFFQDFIDLKNNKSLFLISIEKIDSLLNYNPQGRILLNAHQIKDLEDKKAILKSHLIKLEKIEGQFFTLGKLLRTTKTIKNVFADNGSSHIKQNFITKYIKAINQASDPIERVMILQNMKRELRDLLGDLTEFQSENFSEIEKNSSQQNTAKTSSDDKSNEYFQYVISKVMEKVFIAFGEGFGDFMAEKEVFKIEGKSSLSNIPSKDFSNLKNVKEKEAWQKLYKFFGQVSSGKTIMTPETLLPYANEIESFVKNDESQIKSKNYSSDQIMQKEFENSFDIISSTKEVFDEYYEPNPSNTRIQGEHKDSKFNFSKILVGFIPFCSSEEKQYKIEAILETEKFKNLFSQKASGKDNIKPSLLSRIMFLYNRYEKEIMGYGKKPPLSS